eukprot:TRINITY_DN31081_c0_g2_i1.p1 TRINITY_DN31081_c0_g2~~TRINITY_DN31081_c0_g2_i1.p1  ORF type:complete len:137 (+),score=35.48 TRINITY_DN31081_c0_g2_i1:1-411(+)
MGGKEASEKFEAQLLDTLNKRFENFKIENIRREYEQKLTELERKEIMKDVNQEFGLLESIGKGIDKVLHTFAHEAGKAFGSAFGVTAGALAQGAVNVAEVVGKVGGAMARGAGRAIDSEGGALGGALTQGAGKATD